MSDAAAVLNVVVGAGSCEISVCDVDRDGLVTVSDALTLLRFAAGVIPSLPCQAAAESDSGLTPVEMKCAVRWLKLENLCSAEARR